MIFIIFVLSLQPFERYVQTGRVVKCTAGPLRGRLATIVDVIDQNRVSIIPEGIILIRTYFMFSVLH